MLFMLTKRNDGTIVRDWLWVHLIGSSSRPWRVNHAQLPAIPFPRNSRPFPLLIFGSSTDIHLSFHRASIDCVTINPSAMLRTTLRRTTQSAFSGRPTQFIAQRARRSYADAAPAAKSENLKLSLSVPHQSIYSNKEVYVPRRPCIVCFYAVIHYVNFRPLGVVQVFSCRLRCFALDCV